MTTQLTLVPDIHTAIHDLLLQVSEEKRSNPFAPVTILLPTASVTQDLRERLGDMLGVHMLQFYRLGQTILDEAGIPIQEMHDTAIRRLIRSILQEMFSEGSLSSFAAVHDKPGFTEVLLSWVRELKSQGITPEEYAKYADQAGNERDRQLAQMYNRYQAFMHQQANSDADGLLWVAAEAMEQDANLLKSPGALFVVGFDQFTPVQLRILQQLQGRFAALELYLAWDAGRSESDRALTRLAQTRDALLRNLVCQVRQIETSDSQEPILAHLHKTLFQPGEKIAADGESMKMVAAPSREAEVRHALREVKRLLLAGIPASEVAILSPNSAIYLPLVRTDASEYGLPVEHEMPLVANPAIAALIHLLHLSPDFPWRATLDSLRSPYIRQNWLSLEQIDTLDQLSREQLVIAGRDQWLAATTPLDADRQDMDDEDIGKPALAAQTPAQDLLSLQAGLGAFFDHLTPPVSATYADYTAWIQAALVGLFPEEDSGEPEDAEPVISLNLLACCREGPVPERDLGALALLMSALRRLLSAAEITPGDKTVSWDAYRAELLEILQHMLLPAASDQLQVRFGRLEEGRAREFQHLFVMGLSEGEFSARPAIDVLYAPQERQDHPLALIRYTAADDASLWWQVLGNVRQRLTLLRPYIDGNGAPWQASPYWDAVLERFSDLPVETIKIAEHPTLEQAASLPEWLTALAYAGAQEAPNDLAGLWKYAQQAQVIMQQRQSYLPLGEFEGVIQSTDLVDEIEQRFAEEHCWSASRLNRYANCPYGFFAEVVLKLAARDEPQDGLDAMQRGSLLHAVLEHFYRNLAASHLEATLPNLDEILNYLEQSCTAVFATAPRKFGFRAGAL
ncbi:MAG: PD-(D/E)XK nuclease family protein, partial [Anaerolineales bacterium]